MDFDPVNLEQVPSDSYDASFRLNYAANTRTSIFTNFGLGWFTSENAITTESFSASATIGGTHVINRTMRANGSVGLSFINTEEEVGGLRSASWSTALLFDGGITQDYANGTMRLGFSQRVSPTAGGELALNTSVNAGMSYDLNRNTQLNLSGSIGRQSGIDGGDASTVVSVSPSLSLEVAEGLGATAGYTLRTTGGSTSHRFNLGVNRSFGGVSP